MLFFQMDWKEFINSAFTKVNIALDGSRKVVVYATEFLKNLTVILNEIKDSEEGIM